MDNQEIAARFRLLASLMELHDENAFKIRAIQTAVFTIEKFQQPLCEMSDAEIAAIAGIGKSIASKITECCQTNELGDLLQILAKTPQGVAHMLDIKGIGPKKVRALWKELGIENKEQLLEACSANRVASLKGFGEKTQETIRQNLVFKEINKDRFLYAEAEYIAYALHKTISASGMVAQIEVAGDVRRKLEIVESIQLIAGTSDPTALYTHLNSLSQLSNDVSHSGPYVWRGTLNPEGIRVELKMYSPENFAAQLYIHSSSPAHLSLLADERTTILQLACAYKGSQEIEILEQRGLAFIEPEMREGFQEVELAKANKLPKLLNVEDLKGTLHNHSTYSDGKNTIEEMAIAARNLGLEYLGLCDHSKSGNFYNQGMYEYRVAEQHREIDELNKKLAPFKIFKGIESDILSDGSLDYDNNLLATFDFIVASVHSNLKMNEMKATERLIAAIENQYTTILGHASGRILLQREAYPLDYKKIIDACDANGVVIEINADPHRLDMDWRHVYYALEKGVMISINPDAHSIHGYENTKYGVYVGRKAGLTKEMTFNAMSAVEIQQYFLNKRKAVKA